MGRTEFVVLVCALLLFAHARAQVTSPQNFASPALNATTLSVWQACAIEPFSSTTLRVNDVLALCGGNVLFGCYATASNDTIYGAVGTTHAIFDTGGSFVNTLTGLPVYVSRTSTILYGGNQTGVTSCATDAGGVCMSISGGTFSSDGYCPGLGNVFGASNVFRAFFTDPCNGLAPGASCAGVQGQCAGPGTCDSTYICVNQTAIPNNSTYCSPLDRCDPANGNVTYAPRANGTACASDDYCFLGGQCYGGECALMFPRACASPDPCTISLGCNSTSAQCMYEYVANGSLCIGGPTRCTGSWYCNATGQCTRPPQLPPPVINDGCTVGLTCNDTTGWTYGSGIPVGMPCNSSDACVESAVCGPTSLPDQFVCEAQSYNLCTPITDCFYAIGGCIGGACNFTQRALGATCDDYDPCTSGTTCSITGQCRGGTPTIACTATPPPCYHYVLQASGMTCVCALEALADGATCYAGTGECTNAGTCTAAICSTTTPRTCPGDECNSPTTCNPTTGCINPVSDGTPCTTPCRDFGTCFGGYCTGGVFNNSNPACTFAAAPSIEAWLAAAA